MKRREFIAGLGSAAAWPVVARAQQPAMPVTGLVRPKASYQVASFRKGLSEAGYVEGVNVAIEFRWANRLELGPPQAAELSNRRVNVLAGNVVVEGGTTVERKATALIPIVKIFASDPAEDGVIASLNQPGGNITGVDMRLFSLATKRLELLREAMPNALTITFGRPQGGRCACELWPALCAEGRHTMLDATSLCRIGLQHCTLDLTATPEHCGNVIWSS